jgi:uncharacterized membrane protein YuzA (DUF378 family)
LVALLDFDVVAWLFGDRTLATRAVYLAVGVAAIYCLWKLPRWSRAG